MYPEIVNLISDSDSESMSVNGDQHSNAVVEQVEAEVETTKADDLRESLRNKGWIEIDASNIKDSLYRLYACNGEVWNYKSKKSGAAAETDPDDQSTGERHRTLEFRVQESQYYECHRAHEKRIRAYKPDDETIDRRNIVRPSKKNSCKARLVVRLYEETPEIAYVQKKKDHDTHSPGDAEDIEHIMTTKYVRDSILHMLRNGHGITRRQIRMWFNRETLFLPIQHTDAQLRTEALAYIYRKWHNECTQKDKDDAVSVALWLDDLESREYTVWRIGDTGGSCYAFGFCSTWQRNELLKSDNWSMDATHHMGPHANALLYTIMVRHELADRGIPVAYLFTNDRSADPVTKWLQAIADMNASPKIITSDCDPGEVKAIRAVWGDECRIQYCTWHVQRAWMNQLVDKAVEWGTARNKMERKYREMQEIHEEIKALMWEQSKDGFFERWDAFKERWSRRQFVFVDYFEKQWMTEDKYPRWARCYHPEVYTNMLTNNYVESWHNQLKTVYLQRKYPRRVDFLIFTLVDEVEIDMVSIIKQRAERNGALTNFQRHMLTKKKQANELVEDMTDVQLSCMIEPSASDTNAFLVHSFALDCIRYTVTLKHDTSSDTTKVMACSCLDYKRHNKACKHMFLLARWNPAYVVNRDYQPQRLTIELNPSSPSRPPSTSRAHGPNNVPASSSTTANDTNDNTSMDNPRDTIKSQINRFKRSLDQGSFNSEKLLDIIGKLDNLQSELDQARILPPNARLPPQHLCKRSRTRK